jgi:hypothetical protein
MVSVIVAIVGDVWKPSYSRTPTRGMWHREVINESFDERCDILKENGAGFG